VPILQQLVSTLTALVQALQGAGAITTGGGAMGAPTAAGASGAPSTSGGGGHAGHAGHAGAGPNAGKHQHHGMRIIKRDRPDDLARAQRNFDAVYGSFRTHGRAGLDFKNNQTHGYISAAEQAAFRRQHPGLPVPQSIVFREGSNTPIGVTYRTTDPNFDLGMGDLHDHTNDNGSSRMQHIWFTPGDLRLAFSDVEHGMTGGMSAVMRKRGYPT
jgi:hypothetical protein